MTSDFRLFAECPSYENQQGDDKGAEYHTGNNDGAHPQSLFQLPFFQISRRATRNPITISKIAIGIPISHSMRFPIQESETSDCRATKPS